MEMEVERSGMEEREREEYIGDEHGDGDGQREREVLHDGDGAGGELQGVVGSCSGYEMANVMAVFSTSDIRIHDNKHGNE